MKIKVLIADDHAIVREGMKMILDSQPHITVIGEAKDGRDAVAQAIALRPDIVIMDIAMPGLNGIEATHMIHQSLPMVKIIILSMHNTSEYVFRAMQAGAQGYILKESAGSEIHNAIHAVMAGKSYCCGETKKVQESLPSLRKSGLQSPLERLSGREREVLQLVVEGKTSVEIAAILNLSPKSVETYRSRMMQKLRINDVPSLVKFAIQHGITPEV